MTYTMNGDMQIRVPNETFRIVGNDGETLREGGPEKFAALMDGMHWEEDGIFPDAPSHRRLVSQWFRIEDDE